MQTLLMKNLFSSLFNCNKNKKLFPIIDEIDHENFIDLNLRIVKKEKSEDGYSFTAKGYFEDQTVGFKIFIKNNLQAGVIEDGLDQEAFYSEAIIFKSIGEESNQFINALSKLYGLNNSSHFRKEIKTTAFPLNSIVANLNQANYYKYKVFFEQDELYAELYINIDLKSEILEFHEKDITYREDILKALT